MRPRPENREPFVHSFELATEWIESHDRFPLSLPILRNLGTVKLHPAVTFFVGENGSGKSTLIEALAVRIGCDELLGEAGKGIEMRAPDGGLHDYLRLRTSLFRRSGSRFFMRAETVFDLAAELDRRI